MKVTNNTSEQLIAFCGHKDYGHGKDTTVKPGETKEIPGPFVGKMENMIGIPNSGNAYIVIQGDTEIICHCGEDGGNTYHVSKGKPLFLTNYETAIAVRHYSDERDAPNPPDYGD